MILNFYIHLLYGIDFLKTHGSSPNCCWSLVNCETLRESSLVANNDLRVEDDTVYGKSIKKHTGFKNFEYEN